MSTTAAQINANSFQAVTNRDWGHRARALIATAAGIAMSIALTLLRVDYYILDQTHRPLSPKHEFLKPSGFLG